MNGMGENDGRTLCRRATLPTTVLASTALSAAATGEEGANENSN